MKKSLITLAILAGVSMSAFSRDNIQIAGSSTVLPFASIVAEEFGKSFPQFSTPVVGSGGSSGGLRQFCQGVGENTIDIANSSRQIKDSEVAACATNGVKNIKEVKFGYDGIVFASAQNGPNFALAPKHIYLATAAKVPVNGKLVANLYTKWSQIDKTLPTTEITVVIPGSNHGTREVYEEKTVLAGCETFPEIEKMNKKEAKDACLNIRTDGRVIEIAGDYTETLAKLQVQKNVVGVFGLSFYEQNKDKLKVASINKVFPSQETIISGEYPVSRPLFFYVKMEHVGKIPGIIEYSKYFLSPQVSGPNSLLEQAGLVPLNSKERKDILSSLK